MAADDDVIHVADDGGVDDLPRDGSENALGFEVRSVFSLTADAEIDPVTEHGIERTRIPAIPMRSESEPKF
ncbi:hypothetical protein [Natronorarus salvus]|uniref:hypothetical protein n=1 Tax=Natronorarus salvus TaxID=3117733 RepID=UPI002F264C65